jgi:aldose 1-epimerase
VKGKDMSSEVIQIRSGKSQATISAIGCALVSLTLEGAAVIPEPASPRHPYHGVLLAPWPNRIRGGKYALGGKNYQLAVNEDFGNALHGLLFDRQAILESQSPDSITLVSEIVSSPSYPWSLTVRISFSIRSDGLRVETTATNNSAHHAPVALGTHPFFVFDEGSTLEVRAKKVAIHGGDMLPVSEAPSTHIGFGRGAQKSIENVALDVQFSSCEAISAVLRTKDWNMEIWQDNADWLMVYTTQAFNWADGRTRAVALEPQTSAADSFNSGEGLTMLAPGESCSYRWGAKKTH